MKSEIGMAAKVLHKLLKINNDRVECYQEAAEKTHELDLKTALTGMADESKKNVAALTREIIRSGDGTFVNSHSKHRNDNVWTKINAIFSSRSQSILNSCERDEDATQAAYHDAISSKVLTMGARQLVRNQQVALKSLYDMLMKFRDGHPVITTQIF